MLPSSLRMETNPASPGNTDIDFGCILNFILKISKDDRRDELRVRLGPNIYSHWLLSELYHRILVSLHRAPRLVRPHKRSADNVARDTVSNANLQTLP